MLRGVALLVLAAAPVSIAQAPTAFEAASIKRNVSGESSAGFQIFPDGQFRATNATVRQLVQSAFDFEYERFQIVGGPAWIDVERYDVQATLGERADPARTATPQEIAVRIRRLLSDRLKLVMRRETREMTYFQLVIERPNVLKATNDSCISSGTTRAPGETRPRCGLSFAPDSGDVQHLIAAGTTMATLARRLQQSVESLVVDKTGLTGTFDFTLDFLRPNLARSQEPAVGVTVFTAVQEQLGLRLQSARGPVDVIAIASVERPSEN
jgi:uncharacterized protein (TIGR03435 family)